MENDNNALTAVLTGLATVQLELLLELAKAGVLERVAFAEKIDGIAQRLGNEHATRVVTLLASGLREEIG